MVEWEEHSRGALYYSRKMGVYVVWFENEWYVIRRQRTHGPYTTKGAAITAAVMLYA